MGLFNSEPKIYQNFDSRVFIGNSISNVKSILNLGLVKASVTVQSGKFTNEDEVAKVELINLTQAKGGNLIINFKYETGSFQRTGSGSVSSYIIAYGDAVFIEYNN